MQSGVRRRGITILSSLALAGGLLAPLAPAQAADRPTFPSSTAAAQAAIAEAVAEGAVDSITIGLTDAQGLIWTSSAGRIDAAGTAPSPDTMFGIGSVSKVVTTAAVMQLVDQGRVGLDQPVATYLPRFTMLSPQYRQITVRMLLNHTAGFPGSDYANGWTTSPFPGYAQQAMNTLAQSTLKTTPGALNVYCNDCFTVAGQVVAAVSGMPFTTYVERHVLAPLGMQHSGFITKAMPKPGTVARTFDGSTMRPQEITNIYASGGMLSTPTDMAALARMLLNQGATSDGRLLSSQSVAEMGRSQIATTLMPVSDPYLVYGLGWDSVSMAALRLEGVRGWTKNGSTDDYHANFVLAPDNGLAVFASAAGEQAGIDAVVAHVSDRLLVDALREQGTIGTRSLSGDVPARATPSTDDVNAMLGIYLASANGSMRVTATGEPGVLQLHTFDAGRWMPFERLAFRADGTWWPEGVATHSWRTAAGWSRNYLVQVFHSGDKVVNYVLAQRVEASGPTAKAWSARVGEWLLVNERPDSTTWRGPSISLARIPGLPGYLDMGDAPLDAHGTIGTMFAQVPMNNGRDQQDAVPVDGGMLRVGYRVLRPAASVPVLPARGAGITIGAKGYAEWVRVPASGTVTVRDAQGWYLYGADMSVVASGIAARPVRAPAGARLVVMGTPGTTVRVSLR